ncbi:deaminase domain-containing protein [Priestia endophytica]
MKGRFRSAKEYVVKGKEAVKRVRENIGNVKIPVGVRVADTGMGARMIVPEKRSLKELGQQFSMKSGGSGSRGTGKVYPTRQIDPITEAHIISRIKELRGSLTSKYKTSGNFALAEVNIEGISKKEFYASSKIDELKGTLIERVPDISLKPKNPVFKATEAPNEIGDFYLRDSDTEYKILNEIAPQLGNNTEATGKIKLFTELDTCDSCSQVIAEFADKYRNIDLEVIHNNGGRIKP